jgi:dihydrofolate synthase/folylpolyglutamate synthase
VNYPESVHFLYALGNEIKTAKLGLERIRAVLDAMGRPQDRLRFVHVAGTNGKGSTCAMIESGLRAAGIRTGLFTSPHLLEPTERIRIDGQPISAGRFAEAFDEVHAVVERLLAEEAIDLHTTYFETVTAMAILVFEQERVDRVVLEVGLGGRLDATNIVQPELCVITPIDFDHEAMLGRSLEAIAREKAGILKPGVPAVIAPQRPEAATVVGQGYALPESAVITPRGSKFQLGALHISCPLAGEHQVVNAATAALALERLGVRAEAIEAGIARTEWPGRLERVSEDPEIILDGAHNPSAARALAAYIDRFYAGRHVCLIYGTMRDKAVEEIAGILFPRAARVILTAPCQARALAPEAMRDLVAHPDLRITATLTEALAMAEGDAIFITGSLFLVAEAEAMFRASSYELPAGLKPRAG